MHWRSRVHWMLKKHPECIHKVKDDKCLAKAIQKVSPPSVSCTWTLLSDNRCSSALRYVNISYVQAGQGHLDWLCFACWTVVLKSNFSAAEHLGMSNLGQTQLPGWHLGGESETVPKILVILYPVNIYGYLLSLHGWRAFLKVAA